MSSKYNKNFLACKCGKKPEPRITYVNCKEGQFVIPFKGRNNEELCHKCAENVCQKCGRKEKIVGWSKDGKNSYYFALPYVYEKDENNPSGEWAVVYCSRCNPEEIKRQWKYHPHIAKWGIEEIKNNNQKPIKPNESGQNQKSNKSDCNCQSALDKLQDWEVNAKAKVLANCQNDKHVGYYEDKEDREGAYLNILTEKCACGSVLFSNKYGDKMVRCSKCWESKSNSQKQDINSHKRKGEELDNECEPKKIRYDNGEKSPVSKIEFVSNEKSDSENNPIKPNNKTLIINLKTIKKITLTSDGNLVIEFNINDKSETQIITNKQITNSQELQKAKNYLQKENKNSISQQEFNSLINANSTTPTSTEKPKNNYALLIGGGITILVVGVVIGLLVRNRVKKSKLKR